MLLRLLWRPAMLLMLPGLLLVSLGAGWDLAQGPVDLASAILYGGSTLDLRLALWRLVTLVPAVTGLFLSITARELQHTVFAWTLPGLPDGLRTGKVAIGLVVGALLAVFASRMLGPEVAVGAFGWALLCYALGGVAFDPVLSKLESRGVPAILALVVFRPAILDQLIAAQPILIGAATGAGASALLLREFSTALSRRRPLAVSSILTTGPLHTRQYWSRHSGRDVEWDTSVSRDRLADWLRAGNYEMFGGSKAGFWEQRVIQIAITVAVCYWTALPMLAVIIPWTNMDTAGMQLSSKFLYPMDRISRAKLYFLSTLLQTLAVSAVAIIALAMLFALDVRTPLGEPEAKLSSLLVLLLFFAAWAPVGHWGRIRGGWVDKASMSASTALRHFAYVTAFIMLAMLSDFAFRDFRFVSPSAKWVAVVTLIAAIYTAYWLALKWFFTTRDLIVARS